MTNPGGPAGATGVAVAICPYVVLGRLWRGAGSNRFGVGAAPRRHVAALWTWEPVPPDPNRVEAWKTCPADPPQCAAVGVLPPSVCLCHPQPRPARPAIGRHAGWRQAVAQAKAPVPRHLLPSPLSACRRRCSLPRPVHRSWPRHRASPSSRARRHRPCPS